MTLPLKITFITLLFLSLCQFASAQKLKVSALVSYGSTRYHYDESDQLNITIKTSALPAIGFQASTLYAVTNSFHMGTGLQFISIKGTTDPIFINRGHSNPNTTGDFTLEVKSSYLRIPIEFKVFLSQKWKVKPLLAGGYSIFLPLQQSYFARINPVNPSDFYSKVETRFNKGKEYRGLFIGAGASVSLTENRNAELRVSYHGNHFFYDSPVPGSATVYEVRTLKFKIVEFSLGVNIL